VLGSSKAITALVANYEARIRMKRDLLYHWRKKVWKKAAKLWEKKDSEVRQLIDGRYRIHVLAPELTPRDELEIANMAINLVNSRLWSMERAMDRTGVEDPTDEKNLIRSEQTDAALNPASVQAQVSLATALQSLGIQPGQMGQPGAAGATQEQTENTARTLNQGPEGTSSLNAEENQANQPPEATPANARPGASGLAQTLVQDGEASGRIVTQTPIGAE
jgi:hypothetical protein